MNRTTIMLPKDLKLKAEHYAQELKISLGELIRKSLVSTIGKTGNPKVEDPFFADQVIFTSKTPSDLSKNHDQYLYGDK